MAVALLALAVTVGSPHRSQGQVGTFLQITPNPTDFDTTLCGTTKCRRFELRNISNVPITINGITPILDPITQDPGDPVTLPIVLAPAAADTITLCYSPTSAPQRDTVRLLVQVDTAAIGTMTDTLVLTGRSVTPQIAFNPSPHTFGNVNIGTQLCLSVTITNGGDAPLVITGMSGVDAPFSHQTPSAAPIPPGGNQSLQICFQPTNTGPRVDTAIFTYNGCRSPGTLVLTGTGIQPTPNIGPVLQIDSTVTDLDTTLCGTTKCRNVVLRNIGSDPLNVTLIDPLVAPFVCVLPTLPFQLQPNDTRLLQVCYAPTVAPARDSQRVNMIADNRVSLTVATVIDVSGSMTLNDGTGQRRDRSAHDGGQTFVRSLINNPALGIVDTGAVYEFAGPGEFQRLTNYTTSTLVLEGAIPPVATGGGTRIYDAVLSVSADLQGQNIPGRRFIVLLTDGQDNPGGATLAQAIAAANAAGVRIYTIGYGGPGDVDVTSMTSLATQTGGFFRQTNSAAELAGIFLEISNALSRNIPTSFLVRGRAVRPLMTLAPASIDFDSIRVGQNACQTVTISNTGDAPLNVTSVTGLNAPFQITNPAIPTILPGQQTTAQLCFTPTLLRLQRDTVSLGYVSCSPTAESVALRGVGYDSLVVEVRDTTVGRPGSTIRIPILLQQVLPAAYGVDSFTVALSYNKTMLSVDPTTPVVTDGTIAQGMITESVERTFDGPVGTTTVRMRGQVMSSATPNDTLIYLRFLVLHGDSLITPVTISSATFADGNPKLGRIDPAFFVADSLCYQQRRLIDASALINGVIDNVVLGADGAEVAYRVSEAGRARLSLHDGLGRLVDVLADDRVDPGHYLHRFDVSQLADGTYYLVLETIGRGDVRLIMITR